MNKLNLGVEQEKKESYDPWVIVSITTSTVTQEEMEQELEEAREA